MLPKRINYCGVFWFLIMVFFIHPIHAQQIEAEVKIILERLPLEKQEIMSDFAEDIETYINEFTWTDEELEAPIPVLIQVYLTDKSVSFEDRYAGTFLITNKFDIQYYDKYWYFPFQPGDMLEHQEGAFHPLTGFIDFYVNLILGGEFDKFDKFLGTPFYENSRQINDQAQFESRYISGWRERNKLIEYIFDDTFKLFREMKDLYYLGVSYIGEDNDLAQDYCLQSLNLADKVLIENPDSKEATHFIQAHHLEYVDLFKDNRDAMEKLIEIDPDREETYREYMN